jgi:hypothetical protein
MSSERVVSYHINTRRHNTKHHELNVQRLENLKSHINLIEFEKRREEVIGG